MSDVEQDELIGRIAAELRKPVVVDPGFDARLMAAVRAEPRRVRGSGAGDAWRWLVRPRTISLSPVAGLAIAAALAGLVILAARNRPAGEGAAVARVERAPSTTPVLPAASSGRVMQLFIFVRPRAASVALVGDFNDWDPTATPMQASANGVWSVVFPLAPGRHEYAFVVDGKHWAIDPAAPSPSADDFGSPNSVITVAEAAS